MAQLHMTISMRLPLRLRAMLFFLRLWVWAGSKFPDGLVWIEIDPKVVSAQMQYRAGGGRWRSVGD